MNYKKDLQLIKEQIKKTESHEEKVRLLVSAILLADKHNDLDSGFQLRKELIDEESDTNSTKETIPAFAWLLNACQKFPDKFDINDVLWHYKWVVSGIRDNYLIPRSYYKRVLEDFKQKIVENGYGLQMYYAELWGYHWDLEEYEEAEKYLKLSLEQPSNALSDCDACMLSNQIKFYLDRKKIDIVLNKMSELEQRKLKCESVPFSTYCSLTNSLFELNHPKTEIFFAKALKESKKHGFKKKSLGLSYSRLLSYMQENEHPEFQDFIEKIIGWEIDADNDYQEIFSRRMSKVLKKEKDKIFKISMQHPLYQKGANLSGNVIADYYEEIKKEKELLYKNKKD